MKRYSIKFLKILLKGAVFMVMDVKFKVEAVSKNRISLIVVAPKDDDGKLLKPTGSPSYGQCDLIVPEDEVENFAVGTEFDVAFEASEPEDEEETN